MNKFTNLLSLVLASAALVISLLAYDKTQQTLVKVESIDPMLAIEALTEMLPTATSSAPADVEDEIAKVVYHVDYKDPRRFSAMLTSINNMATTFQNEMIDYDIRMVFVANGIRFLTDDKLEGTPFAEDKLLAARREELKGRLLALQDIQEVKLEACDITRRQVGLEEDQLYEGAYTVPSGVVRLAQLQGEGFSYIKIE